MRGFSSPLFALLASIFLLQTANGLFTSLLGVRMVTEAFPTGVTGLVASAYFAGLVTGSIAVSRIIESVGHVRSFAAFASIVSACAVSHAIFVDPIFWGLMRFVTGLCMAGIFMVAESWLNGATDNEHRGATLSLYMIGHYISLGGGQQLLHLSDPNTFVLFALASILFSIALVPLTLARSVTAGPLDPSRLSIKALYKASPLGVTGSFAAGAMTGAWYGLGPVFAVDIGLSVSSVATFLGAGTIGGMIIQWPNGKLSDRFDRRAVLTTNLFLSAIIAFAISQFYNEGMAVLLILAACFGGTSFTIYSLSVAHCNDQLDTKDMVPASAGLLFAYGVGASLGPFTASQVMGFVGPQGLFLYATAGYGLVGLFAIYRIFVRSSKPLSEQLRFVSMPRMTAAAMRLDPRAKPNRNRNSNKDKTAGR